MLALISELNPSFVRVFSFSLPKYILYDIVDWNVNWSTFKAQWNHKSFCTHFLLFFVQIQIYETFYHFLLQSFTSCSSCIYLVNLISQILYLHFWRLLFVDAFIELFMDHVISKPSQRRSEMGVALKVKSVMPIESIQVSFVGGKFLNLNGPQE